MIAQLVLPSDEAKYQTVAAGTDNTSMPVELDERVALAVLGWADSGETEDRPELGEAPGEALRDGLADVGVRVWLGELAAVISGGGVPA